MTILWRIFWLFSTLWTTWLWDGIPLGRFLELVDWQNDLMKDKTQPSQFNKNMQIFLVGSVVGTHTYILVYFHKLFHYSFSKGIWIKLACFGWKNSLVTFFGLWSGLLQIFFIVAYKAYQCLQYSYWSKFDCPTQSPKTLLCERRGKTIRTGGGTVCGKR